ncbi:glycosyl hydrolase family 61-domain-containing protein [Mycena rosella]|uniref:AA9 family lytic polysaccharide monooxygenase n=1 Tax=Mycena rosella TaxID=1033263 RepID=A0AAD7GF25_MYCRO|nr:glycosyl hydrolase family 61-domain-containing protein [Mycena rosella]
MIGSDTSHAEQLPSDPILDPMSPQLACNDDGTSGALQLTARIVQAGSPFTAYWSQVRPHPYGPMFKIDESGLINGTVFNGYWGSGKMIDQTSWTTTIPATVSSGNYLLRFETIALHSLSAQFYPECAQISITGGGTLAPTAAQFVFFPGTYSAADLILDMDIYTNEAQVRSHMSEKNQIARNGSEYVGSRCKVRLAKALAIQTVAVKFPGGKGSCGASRGPQARNNKSSTSESYSYSLLTEMNQVSETSASPATACDALRVGIACLATAWDSLQVLLGLQRLPPTSTTTSTAPTGMPRTVAQFGQCGGYTGQQAVTTPFHSSATNDN